MHSLLNDFQEFLGVLENNKNIHISKQYVAPTGAGPADIDFIESREKTHPQILNIFREVNGFKLEWEAIEYENDSIQGRVNLLPLEQSMVDWKGIVYFQDTHPDDPIRRFFILDFFVDEACVGFYSTEEQKPNVYLYQFEDVPFDLKLDMPGYIKMMIAANGFRYWQLVLKEIISGKANPISEQFKKFMPKLFLDYSFNAFIELYNVIKLS